jgi:pimeloyl-ACP methyl ester carboxylesterase
LAHNLALGADASLAQPLDPPAVGRLGEIGVPTLVIVGDRDVPDIQRVADALVAGIAGARKVVMRDTAHVPNMEQPAEFNRLVLDFLASVPTG